MQNYFEDSINEVMLPKQGLNKKTEKLEEVEKSNLTLTDNGAVALNTTDNRIVDLFSTIGSLRSRNEDSIISLFKDAFDASPLLAVKTLFYARDIRGGLGERNTFRILLKWLANNHPKIVVNNLENIAEYGRYDDYFVLLDTPVEKYMFNLIKETIYKDIESVKDKNNSVSLLAKWMPSESGGKKELAKKFSKVLGMDLKNYRKTMTMLRKEIQLVETTMCDNKWHDIDYSKVPSRANLVYRNAFLNHDEDRYTQYLTDSLLDKVKMNGYNIYPHDVIARERRGDKDIILDALWKHMPNHIKNSGKKALAVCDTSASMTWYHNEMPMNVSIGLGIHLAENGTGAFKNKFMTFSTSPKLVDIGEGTLREKIGKVREGTVGSTNLEAAMNLILNTAIQNKSKQEDLPDTLVIISDMQINQALDRNHKSSFYEQTKYKFETHGYKIPQVVFWNVNSTDNVFHADANIAGVQLVSGNSTNTLRQVLGLDAELIDSSGKQDINQMTATDLMLGILTGERYNRVTL